MRRSVLKQVQHFLRKPILSALRLAGHDLDPVSLEGALGRCRRRGVEIGTVIDVGASDGRWTEECLRVWPGASYFLIEAQAPHEAALRKMKARVPKLEYLMAAAGDLEGEIFFDATDLLGGIASHTPFQENCIVVPVTTIDAEIARRGLRPPFLIKLDTHGFERAILQGAISALSHTVLLVVETYNFNFTSENLRFPAMVEHIETLGFRCADLCDPVHRPDDHVLWQFDLFFAPANATVFHRNKY
jgi:FkbM family methyltransferase